MTLPQDAERMHHVRNEIVEYLHKEFSIEKHTAFYIVREIEHKKIKHLTIDFEVKE